MDEWDDFGPLNVHLSFQKGSIVLHWAFKLNIAVASAETIHKND
jgi:hypothetical protein